MDHRATGEDTPFLRTDGGIPDGELSRPHQFRAGTCCARRTRAGALSQLDLALRVGASQRHLSFVETGRSSASRGMLIALADALGMSPGGCNQLLLASGFAPRYGQRPL